MILCNTIGDDRELALQIAYTFSVSEGYRYEPIMITMLDGMAGKQYLVETAFSAERKLVLRKQDCLWYVGCVINGQEALVR